MKSNHYITVMCNAKMLHYTLLGITWKKCNITIALQLHITITPSLDMYQYLGKAFYMQWYILSLWSKYRTYITNM